MVDNGNVGQPPAGRGTVSGPPGAMKDHSDHAPESFDESKRSSWLPVRCSRYAASSSRGQSATSLPAPAREDGSALPRPRPAAEPVLPLPSPIIGLISALHRLFMAGFSNASLACPGVSGYRRYERDADRRAGRRGLRQTTGIGLDLQRSPAGGPPVAGRA